MHHPPPKVRVESLKSDIDAKKGRLAGFTKLQLLHQSLTGAGGLDSGDRVTMQKDVM